MDFVAVANGPVLPTEAVLDELSLQVSVYSSFAWLVSCE